MHATTDQFGRIISSCVGRSKLVEKCAHRKMLSVIKVLRLRSICKIGVGLGILYHFHKLSYPLLKVKQPLLKLSTLTKTGKKDRYNLLFEYLYVY